ncbi:hypothetical protein WT77_18930 [Burkholderia stagnalis]|nr:hypothetical protein WT77_18930 [Burkholderia stagnalis]
MDARCAGLLCKSDQWLLGAAFSHHEVGKFVDNDDKSLKVCTIGLSLCKAARIILTQNRLALFHFLDHFAKRSYGVRHIGNNLCSAETITSVIVGEIDTFRVDHKQLGWSSRDEQGNEQSI